MSIKFGVGAGAVLNEGLVKVRALLELGEGSRTEEPDGFAVMMGSEDVVGEVFLL
jgi:hypothetical protein